MAGGELEQKYGEQLYSLLMEARSLGLQVVIEPGRICPKGTSKREAWEAIVRSVRDQVRIAGGERVKQQG